MSPIPRPALHRVTPRRPRFGTIPGPVVTLLVVATLVACSDGSAAGEDASTGGAAPSDAATPADADPGPQDAHNTLTGAEREAGWRLLFDGESLEGWRGYRQEGPPDGWEAVDGELVRVGPGGDIVTEDQFEDFELSLEWRVEEGGNSGVFYLATEEAEWIWQTAPEMQVLDDARHADGESPLTSAGSNYALHPAPRGVVNPAGEWNHARIVVEDGRVEHWLNGRRIVEYDLGSEDWERRVAESKFAELPHYGQARRGHIGLQDHGDPVRFRNIKVREIG